MGDKPRSKLIEDALARAKPLTRDERTAILERMEPLLKIESHARWLKSRVPPVVRSVALTGVAPRIGFFDLLPGVLAFRRLDLPVLLTHLLQASDEDSRGEAMALARYSQRFSAELLVRPNSLGLNDDKLLGLVWSYAALIKIMGHTELSCPAEASCSWDLVSIAKERRFRLLDDAPNVLKYPVDKFAIDAHSLSWARDNGMALLDLRNAQTGSRRLDLAVSIAWNWNHTREPRFAMAALWAGLDSMFGDRRDGKTKRALVTRIAAWLPEIDPLRVGDLYEHRCDAVHGRPVSKEMSAAIADSWTILRRALVRAIERREPPLKDA